MKTPARACMVGLLLLAMACASLAMGRSREDWRLVWSDEFDEPGPPDSTKWIHETGFARNEELQIYTPSGQGNAFVEDGRLVIEARHETVANPFHDSRREGWRWQRKQGEYTSASLLTKGIAAWRYGRIEIRARLPRGDGAWVTFWSKGVESDAARPPRWSEIDIVEHIGRDPEHVHASVHFQLNGKHTASTGLIAPEAPADEFHVYGIDWDAERIVWTLDGVAYLEFALAEAQDGEINPFREAHYLLLNYGLGGGWAGPVDATVLPQRFEVDWVRVRQRAADRGR